MPSLNVLHTLYPSTPRVDLIKFVDPIRRTFEFYQIDEPIEQAAFLAQVGVESQHLTRTTENLNYSPSGLRATWPKRFPDYPFAARYARKPEAIANYVYANRMGNGDEASGDGWRNRGRGLIQVTGHDNYLAVATAFARPLDDTFRDWLTTPLGAALSAGWFWNSRKLNRLAKTPGIEDETRAINGGLHGLVERKRLFDRAIRLLA